MSKVIKDIPPSPWPGVARQLLHYGALEMNPTAISICAKVTTMKHPTQSQVNALYSIASSINVVISEDTS